MFCVVEATVFTLKKNKLKASYTGGNQTSFVLCPEAVGALKRVLAGLAVVVSK
jgi:hypothetical protein